MSAPRIPRDLETRELEARAPVEWTPPSKLPDPAPREGVVYRYVRKSSYGETDQTNMSTRMGEGWRPVLAGDHPEILRRMPELDPKGPVEIGGLVLMQCSKEWIDARNAYYKKATDAQNAAVDSQHQLMSQSDPRMPILPPEMRSETTVRQGKFGTGQ